MNGLSPRISTERSMIVDLFDTRQTIRTIQAAFVIVHLSAFETTPC